MAAPERAELLKEAKAFIESEELMRLATSFPGWVPINPVTGKGPPDWKTALLVLLGLYPIVVIELRFLNPILRGLRFFSRHLYRQRNQRCGHHVYYNAAFCAGIRVVAVRG